MSLKTADREQIEIVKILSDMNRGRIPVEKRSLLRCLGLFPSARKKILNFMSKIFSLKDPDKIPTTDPTPEPTTDPTVFYTPKPKIERTKKSPFK